MTSQQQDLTFFADNSLLCRANFHEANHFLHIISHNEATKPSWLINALIENCLVGTANSVNRDVVASPEPRASVTYISFTAPRESVYKSCRKQGLDLENYDEFEFVDCFGTLFTKNVTSPLDPAPEVDQMFDSIIKKIDSCKKKSRLVLLESPEVLLAATTLRSDDLMKNILKLNRVCSTLLVSVGTSSSIIDVNNTNASDPVFRITDFYVKLHHTSSLNVSIQPLSTGKAKDITGSLCVTKGSQSLASGLKVSEKEYIYHVTKEASVKLYFR